MMRRIVWRAAAALASFTMVSLLVAAQPAARSFAQVPNATMSGPWKPGPIVTSLSSSPELKKLQAFTAPVLLPAKDLQPFATLPLAAAPDGVTADEASYTIYLGSSDGWRVAGARARDSFDAIGRSPEGGFLGGCAPSAAYCAADRAEFFRGLQVNGTAATTVHYVGLSGETNFWDVAWYDEGADTTYSLAAGAIASSGATAAFPKGLSAGHRADAARLADLAAHLVIWAADAPATTATVAPAASASSIPEGQTQLVSCLPAPSGPETSSQYFACEDGTGYVFDFNGPRVYMYDPANPEAAITQGPWALTPTQFATIWDWVDPDQARSCEFTLGNHISGVSCTSSN